MVEQCHHSCKCSLIPNYTREPIDPCFRLVSWWLVVSCPSAHGHGQDRVECFILHFAALVWRYPIMGLEGVTIHQVSLLAMVLWRIFQFIINSKYLELLLLPIIFKGTLFLTLTAVIFINEYWVLIPLLCFINAKLQNCILLKWIGGVRVFHNINECIWAYTLLSIGYFLVRSHSHINIIPPIHLCGW